MRLEGVELRRVRMPLVTPFRTAHGTETVREILLLRAVTDECDGWGECCALREPLWNLRRAAMPLLYGMPGDAKPVTFVEDCAVDPKRLADTAVPVPRSSIVPISAVPLGPVVEVSIPPVEMTLTITAPPLPRIG